MTNKQNHFFNIAREVSFLSDFKRTKVGAVVVEKNRIISTGHNMNKTSPIQLRYDIYREITDFNGYKPKAHAEMAALKPLIKRDDIDWSKVSIYIYREWKNGVVSCAKPCAACEQLIRELGIRTIYYTDWNGYFVKEEIL